MARPFFVFLSLSLLLIGCTQRLICPAFQSAYIYDKDELRKKFSYFLEDSTPKIFTASKTKYLIAEPVSYRKKLRSIQTVQMKPVNPVLPDSMRIGEEDGLLGEDGIVPGAELDLAARSVIDSTYIVDVPQDTTVAEGDSVYMISKDKELRLLKYNTPDSLRYDETSGKYVTQTPSYGVTNITYNVEQDNYMWYLRGNLVLPDVRLAQMMQSEDKASEGKRKKKEKEKGGFFKNLFKRKNKSKVDSSAIEPAPAQKDEFDFVDENEASVAPTTGQEEPKQKKGLFSRKKKQKATQAEVGPAQEPTPAEEKPKKRKKEKAKAEEAKPEEEPKQDDGF